MFHTRKAYEDLQDITKSLKRRKLSVDERLSRVKRQTALKRFHEFRVRQEVLGGFFDAHIHASNRLNGRT